MAIQRDPNDPANGGWGMSPMSSTGAGASATSDPWEQAKADLGGSAPSTPAPAAAAQPSGPTSAPATPGDYSAALGQAPAGSAPATSTAPTAGTSKYAPQLQAIASATDPGAKAIAQDTLARQVYTDLQAAGHQVEWDGQQLVVDGRPYDIGDGTAGLQNPILTANGQTQLATADANTNMTGAGAGAPPSYVNAQDPAAMAVWNAFQAKGMAPRDASDFQYWVDKINSTGGMSDSGNASYWTGRMAQGQGGVGDYLERPETGGSSGLDGWLSGLGSSAPPSAPPSNTAPTYTPGTFSDPTLQGTTDLINKLTANPDSLDPQTIAALKSRAAESASVAGQAQDEDLAHFGGGSHLLDSPWLASARADNAWKTRSSVLSSNQNIDISAAEQNKSDERAAAQLGMSSDQLAQARYGLNEQVKQQATAIGLSRDQMLNQMIIAEMQNATSRHGLDLGFAIDEKKLSEQSDEFKQNMILQLRQLAQQNQQFGARYGLDLAAQNEKNAQDAWNNAKDIYGTGAPA